MKKIVEVISLIGLSLILFGTQSWSSESISIRTEDQRQISATYYSPPAPNAPGVVLIPDTRCDGSVFINFAPKLNQAGFAVLAIDLRYKELIARTRSREESIKLLQSQDTYAPVNYEIKSAIEFLGSQKEVSSDKIALLGTSYGSRVALHSGVKYKVKALVLISLSGQEALPGKAVRELLEEYGNRPVLFMTTEKDWGGNYKAAEHNRLYLDWAKGKKELKIWKGSYHGVDILGIKGAADFTIMWLKENL